MPRILILSATPEPMIAAGHSDHPRIFDAALRALDPGLSLCHANPYTSAPTETDIAQADGVVFVGSSVNWATDAPEAAPLRRAMERVFAAGRPSWGSCNGMQLAAVVLDGEVGASENGVEVGLAQDLRQTEAAAAHPMLSGRSASFTAACIHRDEVTALPAGAELLVTNDHSPVQAFAFARDGVDFWGTQYHPELSPTFIAEAMTDRGDDPETARLLTRAEADPGSAARLGTTPEALRPATLRRELSNWLAHVRATRQVTAAAPAHSA